MNHPIYPFRCGGTGAKRSSRRSESASTRSTCPGSSPAGSASAWQSRALAAGPRILLADEPTASLDKQSGREVVDRMRQLAKRKGELERRVAELPSAEVAKLLAQVMREAERASLSLVDAERGKPWLTRGSARHR